ncbi:mediator of RNA polymerase ii transcription subunit 22 [Anaeramoeba flamelloides]|uniref:Mediator of RNA polymerase ii transcription subunit n=1 Tax=Anaeramoeba flamelloides TaxID=1746091 RepID=A0AAV7Y9D1_9EUKA|nr:mediator of RNA polymerase ii transcription subunit [Anaeramoeba flamelloides]KAJ6253463.1 mediator of RNA polymerase ii transcription subunit 22 [Anaeramoeba flamelloides]
MTQMILKNVDREFETMINSMENIFQTAKINENPNNSRELVELSILSTKIINSAERLLETVFEMKQMAILNDDQSIINSIKEKISRYDEGKTKNDQILLQMKTEVSHLLYQLEETLYDPFDGISKSEEKKNKMENEKNEEN